MGKLIITCVLVALFGLSFGDPDRPGKYLHHDKTVKNCAKYKREANQYQCVLSPFNTEGPFYLPDDHERSDIRDGVDGIPLDLKINVVNSNDCTPLEHMYVHIWHTNALGLYSGVNNTSLKSSKKPGVDMHKPPEGPGQTGIGNAGRPEPVDDERFCRGYQVTDTNGQVSFTTIIPGWYTGRCLHIHIEVYPKNSTERSDLLYVGQIFFDRELPYELKLIDPYSQNEQIIQVNEKDKIFVHHGDETILTLNKQDDKYSASITFGLNVDATLNPQ